MKPGRAALLLSILLLAACRSESTPPATPRPLRSEPVLENTGFVVDLDFTADSAIYRLGR